MLKQVLNFRVITLLVLCLSFYFYTINKAYAKDVGNYNSSYIEAMYLFNLFDFINMPKQEDAKNLCIVGGSNILSSARIIQSKISNFKNINILPKEHDSKFNSCTIVFIDKAEKNNINNILLRLSDKKLLTVSNAIGFIEKGGMINFAKQNNSIKISINIPVYKTSNILLSALFLEVADRIMVADITNAH